MRDLGIDFPAELAVVDAMPLDAELVWNRMNRGLILGAAAETLGDEWASKHDAPKKRDLVAAAAFKRDPARDPAVDEAAARWLPPAFVPRGRETADPEPPASAPVQDDQAGAAEAPRANGPDGDVPVPDGLNGTAAATDDRTATRTRGNRPRTPTAHGSQRFSPPPRRVSRPRQGRRQSERVRRPRTAAERPPPP